MINTRIQACHVLGVPANATETEIKAAYKALVKICHPDSGLVSNSSRYCEIVEAYNFLCSDKIGAPHFESVKVMGSNHSSPIGPRVVSTAKDYAKFEKKMQKQKQEKAAAFEQMTREYSKQIEKQEADYKRAMAAIDAIRAARAIESMIWANGLEKGERPDSDV